MIAPHSSGAGPTDIQYSNDIQRKPDLQYGFKFNFWGWFCYLSGSGIGLISKDER
jgi:hypothetical protein